MEPSPDRPWLKSYPDDVDWNAVPPRGPLHKLLDAAVARFGDGAFLDFLGKTYTYAEVGDLADRAAQGFALLGVKKGVRVGLCLPNCPAYVICYYAILKAGGTVVNYNPLYVERELAAQVASSNTKIMVTLNLKELYSKVSNLIGKTKLERIVVCPMRDMLPRLKGVLFSVLKRGEVSAIPEDLRHVPFAILVNNGGLEEPVPVDAAKDIAVLQYTGGTTGVPKGAALTHANLSANAWQVRTWFPAIREGHETILAVLPFFHVFGMTVVMNAGVAAGALIILLPRFDVLEVLGAIEDKKPTLFPGVPSIFSAINECPQTTRYDLTSIKYCLSGGAPLALATKKRFEETTGCTLVEGYGLSETSPVVTCNPIGGVEKDGSCGLPLPGTVIEIRSPDDPEKTLPQGETGEVHITGPQVMAGYWNGSEIEPGPLTGNRLRTGDLGYLDGDGYLFLMDRIKDVIICNGYNVYPRIIEEAIHRHRAVEEASVIGLPDRQRGEVPKAFVKLRTGQTLNEEDLLEFLKDKLSPLERPRFIEFRDALPKTLIGKPSKKHLMENRHE